MENSNFSSNSRTKGSNSETNHKGGKMEGKSHVSEAASQLYEEGKKLAHEFYDANAQKVNEAQEVLKTYSDDLAAKVKSNPLASVIVAGGIGFILAKIFSK